ncbi:MAG: carboxypeptidase-like regulatory domain-containing protein [Dinghuibacter sp.]|nr:carboxypeptidase-like regulatory domain-containing protein [Dinghuibacter sp.]
MKIIVHILAALFLFNVSATAQTERKIIRGIIKDAHSDERIPYANAVFLVSGRGKLADSLGRFEFIFYEWPKDTLEVSAVGYQEKRYYSFSGKDTMNITVLLDRGKMKEGVVVKTKINRGLILWRKIVRHKADNDRFRFNNFSYDIYNKLELDIVNLNREKLKEVRILKPFGFILDNVDTTSEELPFLPVFLTETVSKYYLQNNPRKTREVITASRTNGINNESVTKLLGGMYQNVNVYNNFIPVFNIDFVSPLSDNGDAYYKYRVVDTQMIGGQRCFHLVFRPKREGDNAFTGDCWVHDTTFAIQKINLSLSKEANVNYMEKLSMVQEFRLLNDSTWFITKDKFVVNIAPVGKSKLTFTGRKTTTYSNVLINTDSVVTALKRNKTREDIVVENGSENKAEEFWTSTRPEMLSKNEQSIYKMMDTLQKMPIFKKYSNTINFLTTGTKYVGNYEIGPWYNWISSNTVEGARLRFDLGTNKRFNKHIYLHGYLAYGFKDRTFKGKAEALWLLNRSPRMWLYGGFTKDYDNGQVYYDQVSTDNVFSLAIRKPGVPGKFLFINDKRVEFFKEWDNGFSVHTGLVQRRFEPIRNLPLRELFPAKEPGLEPLNNFESFIKLRYAYLERFLEGNFYRYSLGSNYPIVEMKFSHGFKNVFGSAYQYNKLSASVSDYMKISPYGTLTYNVFGGKVFGDLPYMLLEMHPGNEIFYYDKYAFNMMNRFEYLSDRYAGAHIEHNIGNGLFKFIPITRKLKFRQFWNAKVLWGELSDNNRALNFVPGHNFKALNDQAYLELGTGIDNILKVLRVDLVWRVLPKPLPEARFQRFAVFGSFRFVF